MLLLRKAGRRTMRDEFTFSVRHRAAPQGSKTLDTGKGGKPFMRESSHGVKPFRDAVKRAALGPDGLPRAAFKGNVAVVIDFEFEQAKSNKDLYPTGQKIGDIDKLTRSVLDALTMAKVIEDDRYVVWLVASKEWGDEDRVTITVRSASREFRPVAETVDFAAMEPDPYYVPKARNPFGPTMIDFDGLSKEPPGFA